MTPPPGGYYSTAARLNDHEFVWMANYKGIHKYDTATDEWTKIMDARKYFSYTFDAAVCDEEDKIIYIGGETKITRIDPDKKSAVVLYRLSSNRSYAYSSSNQLAKIGDDIHIIHRGHLQHSIFNVKNKTMTQIHQFDYDVRPNGSCFIHMKSTNSLLLFALNRSIFEYSLLTKKWNKWKALSPVKIDNVVVSMNEKFILLINNYFRTIYVFDVQKRVSFKSKINIPSESIGTGQAVIMYSKTRDQLLTFGYIRKVYDEAEMNGVQQLPLCLINMILNKVHFEYLHVIAYRDHWKINVDQILASIE